MCGRFSNALTPDQLARRFHALNRIETWQPRWNIAPTSLVPVVYADSGERQLTMSHWGWRRRFPNKAGKLLEKSVVNAIGEEAPQKRMFSKAFRERRCVVPASCYFEWTPKRPGAPPKPFAFRRRSQDALGIAGLWEDVQTETDIERFFLLITMSANPVVEPVHHRMPAVLRQEDEETWLDPQASAETLGNCLEALPIDDLEAWEISTSVNKSGKGSVDGPELLTPIAT